VRGEAALNPFDICVVGGGINGCGIARDAVGRGLSVVLLEKGDLAQGTSSASTKLIHGGLRYLEHYEFRLVREALIEREVLLKLAPHIIWPVTFVLPHHDGLRPAWLLRLGLFLYDHLGGRDRLPATQSLDLRDDPAGAPLQARFTKAFAYADCWVEDSRLVVLNALDAHERGADIRVRTACTSARRQDGLWRIETQTAAGRTQTLWARALVNAAGPWVTDLIARADGAAPDQRPALRLIKGSHLIIDRVSAGEAAYLFQNDDGRVVFAIPYEERFTLIGTTDVPFDGDPGHVTASPEEIAYLCAAASEYLRAPITPDQVRHTYSGVRPLYDDHAASASSVTRDYVFDLSGGGGEAPLLSIFGGKITTYRKLAEHALEKLGSVLAMPGQPWTADAVLPGGDLPEASPEAMRDQLCAERPWLDRAYAARLARRYGTRALLVLGAARSADQLGRWFGAQLTEAELDYLAAHEWALTAEDALWRRTKLALHLSPADQAAVHDWFSQRSPNPSANLTVSA
jgi:glycerol-3-phosphate dehydrogenase